MSNNTSIQTVNLSSTDKQEALKVFTEWLNKANTILLLVFGEGPEIDTMTAAADSLINDPGNFYKAARVIRVPKPEFILEKLKDLKVDCHIRGLDWNNMGEIAMLFITFRENIIAEVILKKEIDQYIKSRISAGIVLALGVDEVCKEQKEVQ